MRYALKNTTTGEYLRGESAWGRRWGPHLEKAKLYHRKADAEAHRTRWYSRAEFVGIVGVTVSEESV